MKVVINTCFGGFGLSDAAYERLIELGIPVVPYKYLPPDDDGLYRTCNAANSGEVIYDNELIPPGINESHDKLYHAFKGKTIMARYWDTWIDGQRSNPLLIQVIEELGEKANSPYSKLKIVEIPDGTDYEIQEYDGSEHIAEKHRTWG